ncbi:MAG: c-type cytochrome biogenesis protein CcsB, partial [Micromonosporaceae bacterium]|nr:c-type cytochrome biogenesis protein CcsB [Micromonosporaceae bacterium]
MPMDPGMASLSDTLLTVTVLSYALAMLGYAIEYAFGARGRVGDAAAQPARELVGVGAGSASDTVSATHGAA